MWLRMQRAKWKLIIIKVLLPTNIKGITMANFHFETCLLLLEMTMALAIECECFGECLPDMFLFCDCGLGWFGSFSPKHYNRI